MREVRIIKVLLEHCAEGHTASMSLEYEVTLGVRHSHYSKFEKLLLERVEARSKCRGPFDKLLPQSLVKKVADVRERCNQLAIVITKS